MANNDFNISIGIQLEQNGQQLLNQWKTLKEKIENDKISINFGDTLNTNLKNISQISMQIDNLSKQVQLLNNTNKNTQIFNTKDAIAQIKELDKSAKNLVDIKKQLSNLGEVSIQSTKLDETTKDILEFVATVKKMNGEITKLQYSAKDTIDGGRKGGLSALTYEFQNLVKVTDNTDKVIKNLQQFKKEVQQQLNNINNTGFADNNFVKTLQDKINNLNSSNFKTKMNEINTSLKELEVQSKKTQENFNSIVGFSSQQQNRLNTLFSNDIVPKDKIINIEAKVSGLQGNESQDYIKSLELEINKLIDEEKRLIQLDGEYRKSIKQTYDEQTKAIQYVTQQEERLKNIKSSYSSKLDINSNGFNKLESEYNSLIEKLEQYRKNGQSLTIEESNNIKIRINDLAREKNSIIEISNVIKQQEQALQSLHSKFGNLINPNEINNIRNSIQGLGTSTNFKGDTSSIDTEILKLKELATERKRLASMGSVISNNSNLNVNSSTREIEQFLKSTVSYKAKISSINEEIDNLGNKIKTVNYNIANGNQINKFRMSIDESSGAVRNLSLGMQDLSSKHANFSSRIKDSIDGLIRFSVSATLMFQSVQQMKNVVQYVTDLDTSITDLSKVVDFNKQTLSEMGDEAVKMGKQLGQSSISISQGFAETGRFLKSKEEIVEFTKAATVASNVTDMTVAESSQALSTALISFKMNAKDVMSIVDQMNSIQNSYRVSAKNIAEGLGTVGAAAYESGIKIQDLEGYLTAMISSTGISGSEAGTAIKTVIARMFRIGKDGEEDAGKTESVLNKYGVAIRDSSKKYKDFTEIMDNVSKKIQQLQKEENSYAVQEIAQTMGGQYQYSKLIALLNNYSTAKEATAKAYNSENSAMDENAKRLDSIQGRLGILKATTEEFYRGLLEGNTIKSVVSGLTEFVNVLQSLTTTSKSSLVEILALGTAIILLAKNFATLNDVIAITKGASLLEMFSVLKGSVTSLGASFIAFATNPVTLVIAGLTALSALAISHAKHQADLKQQTDALTTSYKNLGEAMKSNSTEGIKSSSGDLEKTQKTMQDLLSQKKEIEDRLKDTPADMSSGAVYQELNSVNTKIEEQKKVLKDAGIAFNEATGQIYKLSEAQGQLKNNDIASKIKEDADAQIKHNDSIIALIQEYQQLNSVEDKNATQKLRMSQIANELSDDVKGLVTVRDSEGNVIIQNTDLLGKNIDMLNTENTNIQTNVKTQMEASKLKATAQIGETQMTYTEIKKRIEMYNQEAIAAQAAAQQASQALGVDPEFMNGMGISTGVIAQQMPQLQNAINTLDKIYSSGSDGVNKTTSSLNDGYTPATDKAKKSTDAFKDEINKAKDATKDFDTALKSLDNTIYQLEANMSKMYKGSQTYRDNLKAEIELLQQKNTALDQGISFAKTNANSLNSMGGIVSSAGGSLGNQIIAKAQQYLGTPYVSGGESLAEGGFDCSGLVQFVYDKVGISLNRTSQKQFTQGTPVSKSNLQVGDLVFFKGAGGSADSPGHVALYAGNDTIIESPKTGDVVKTSSLSRRSDYVGARRIISGGSPSTSSVTYSDIINQAGSNFGVDPKLIAAIIEKESTWNPKAISSAGAKGLMQLIDGTAKSMGVSDSFNPYENIMGGTKYLSQLIHKYGLEKGVGLYNTGEYGGGNTAYSNDVIKRYKQYMNGEKSIPQGASGVNADNYSLANGANSLESKVEEYTRAKIENDKKIEELKIALLDSEMLQYDDQVSAKDKEIQLLKNNAELWNEGSKERSDYISQEWKLINEKYGILAQKEQALNNAINSGQYSEQTLFELKTKLADLKNEELTTVRELHDAFTNMWDSQLKSKTQIYDNNISTLQNKLDTLDRLDKDNYTEKIALNNKIIEQEEQKKQKINEQIKTLRQMLLLEKYDSTKNLLNTKIDELLNQVDDVTKSQNDAKNNAVEMAQSAMDMISTVESKIAEMIKKDVEKQKEAYDKDLDNFRSAIEEKKNLINNQYDEDTYNRDLADENQKKLDIQSKINVLSLDSSSEAQAQVVELKKQLAEQQKVIDEKVRQHSKDLQLQALDDQLLAQEKATQSKKDALDKEYSDEEINIKARQMLQDGYYTDIKGNIQDIESVYKKFEDTFGQGMTSMGEVIETQFIQKIQKAIDLVGSTNEFSSLITNSNSSNNSSSSSGSSSGNGNNSSSNNGKIFASGYDLQSAKTYLSGYGYQFVDISDGQQYTASKGDLIIGGSAVTGNIKNDGAKRLYGDDRYKTTDAIKEYVKKLEAEGKSYRNGGLITESEQISVLHGKSANSSFEAVLNEPQLVNLTQSTIMNTLDNLDLSSILSNIQIPSILSNIKLPSIPNISTTNANTSGDVYLQFDKLIEVQGNVDKSVVNDLQQITSNVLSELKNQLNKRGIGRQLGLSQ